MRERPSSQPSGDEVPGLQEFKSALETFTRSRHPIYVPIEAEYQSICAVLLGVAKGARLEERFDLLLHESSVLTVVPDSIFSEDDPLSLASWVDTTFDLNAPGTLHRLNAYSGNLSHAVQSTVMQVLTGTVRRRYYGYPTVVQQDVTQHLFAKYVESWIEDYDPSRAALSTYLAARIGPHAFSRQERISLGLEAEKIIRGDYYEHIQDERRAITDRVEEILDECPEANDEMLRDRYIHGRSTEEIAKKHGMSPGAVRARLSRILKKIRARLNPNHGP